MHVERLKKDEDRLECIIPEKQSALVMHCCFPETDEIPGVVPQALIGQAVVCSFCNDCCTFVIPGSNSNSLVIHRGIKIYTGV